MKFNVRLVALAGLLLFGTAAGGRARRNYIAIYEDYTEHLIVYWDFETALNMRATYLTPEFRMAMADERQRLLNATPEDHKAYTERLLEDGNLYHELVFSSDSAMPKGEEFGTADDKWQIRLLADGTEEKLVSIYKVRKPNPMQRALYPHLTIWSDLWIARFEKTVRTPDDVQLIVSSGYGNGEMWFKGMR